MMFLVIVYVIVLALEYTANGESLFFWIWAGIGIFVVLLGIIGQFVPEKPDVKAARDREKRAKDEIAAMVIGLSDD